MMGKPCDGPYLPVGFCLTTHPAVSYWCVMVDLSPKLSGFGLDLDLLWAVLGLLWGGIGWVLVCPALTHMMENLCVTQPLMSYMYCCAQAL